MKNIMNATDSAGLQNLHDIVPVSPVPWWPPAAGWYFAGAAVLIVLAWIAWATFRRWQANACRRAALKELKELTERLPDNENAARKLPELVKRIALCAWPRRQVAGLSGMSWLEFLDEKSASKDFTQGAGKLLPELAYADSATVCAISREKLEVIPPVGRTGDAKDRNRQPPAEAGSLSLAVDGVFRFGPGMLRARGGKTKRAVGLGETANSKNCGIVAVSVRGFGRPYIFRRFHGPRGFGKLFFPAFLFLRLWFLVGLIPALLVAWLIKKRQDTRSPWKGVVSEHLLKHLLVGGVRRRRFRPLHLLALNWFATRSAHLVVPLTKDANIT